jgi:hypothetical protein
VTLTVLSPREASIFACMTDTVVAPEPALPAVRETDATAAFDRWLARAPRLNRFGLRALVYAVELSPRLLGQRARLRALAPRDRARALKRVEAARAPAIRELVKLLKGIACLCYYGDDAVMLRLGYDAEANVRRARALRAAEARP